MQIETISYREMKYGALLLQSAANNNSYAANIEPETIPDFLLFRWIDGLALLKSPPICYDQQLNLRGICKFFNLFTKLINASK
jgi:hypothetical protein